MYLGAIGGGTYDYIGYLECLREKAWVAIGLRRGPQQSEAALPASPEATRIDTSSDNLQRARRWLIAPKIDVGASFLCLLVFTICFVMLGAAILHPAQLVPSGRELLNHQAQFLTNFHPSLLYVYQLGIFTWISQMAPTFLCSARRVRPVEYGEFSC